MPDQRIKGQEVSILIVADGELQAELTDVRNFEINLDIELLKQAYLGEKSMRYDEIFNGVTFSGELHIHSKDYFDFADKVKSRAKRDTPDIVFNISGVFAFPNGDTPTLTLPDVHFGPLPLNIPGRGEYVSTKIEGGCEDYARQES